MILYFYLYLQMDEITQTMKQPSHSFEVDVFTEGSDCSLLKSETGSTFLPQSIATIYLTVVPDKIKLLPM